MACEASLIRVLVTVVSFLYCLVSPPPPQKKGRKKTLFENVFNTYVLTLNFLFEADYVSSEHLFQLEIIIVISYFFHRYSKLTTWQILY